MIVTLDNLHKLPEKDRGIVCSLMLDVEEINMSDSSIGHIDIEWIDTHTEYSAERVDPCPDYYGMYRIYRDGTYLGCEMDLDTLDSAICVLHNYVIYD